MSRNVIITVAIAAYNRPKGLQKVLDGIAKQSALKGITLRVVVADNSIDANVETLVKEIAKTYPCTLIYYHVPERGISQPRNKGIQDALDNDSDYLAYIDDDETPDKNWLKYLYNAISETSAAAVSGGVKPVFDRKPAWWIEKGGFFEVLNYPEMLPIEYTSTGNVIIDMVVIRDLQLLFDPSFGLTGGEDTLFFKVMREAGYQTMFCREALVYEDISESRSSFAWLIKRWFRTGNTDGILLVLGDKTVLNRIRSFAGGMARILYGVLCAVLKSPLLIIKQPATFECIRVLMRGVGFVSAAFGIAYQEYRVRNR